MSAATTDSSQSTYQLYTYFGSTCSARIIIAARILGIPLELCHVDLSKSNHQLDSFSALNPSQAVPVLVIQEPDGNRIVLTQSIAILEYFEDIKSQGKGSTLLPPAHLVHDRAKVRELVGIIATDIFPPTNGRIAKQVRSIRGEIKDQINMVHSVMAAGFTSYEAMLKKGGSRYSYGNGVTMADVFLVPAFDMAIGYKLDLKPYPTVQRTYDALLELDVFKKENWAVKEDTSA
jgi:maleylacetoacetate isomerase